MNSIVFVEPNKIGALPFTTSEVIAEYAQVKPESVDRLIRKQSKALEAFGQVGFEIRAVKYARGTNEQKIYHFNEEQATLLITFLKNTEPVVKFKTELVRQFYLMKSELLKRQILREQLKPIRRELTDAIQDKPDHSKWDFKLYTDLAYKSVTGKNSAQLRKERGAPKNAKAIEYLTADEIAAVTKLQNQIGVLLEMGMDYQQVKMLLLNRQVVGNIA